MRRRLARVTGWVLVAVVVVTLAALTRVNDDSAALSPDSHHPDGAQALTTLLGDHGVHVHASSDLARLPDDYPGTVVVALSTGLSARGWSDLARRTPAHLVVVVPDSAALSGLAPSVSLAEDQEPADLAPSCAVRPATSAGTVHVTGDLLDVDGGTGVTPCYPGTTDAGSNEYALVRVSSDAADRPGTVDLVATDTPFTNAGLATSGNAAFALNLVGDHRDLLWLTPGDQDDQEVARGGLLPDWLGPAIEATALCGLVVVLWRGRRLGRVATEPLPVLVRGSETVEGRGRLYQRARARSTAAEHLRAAAIRELATRLGVRPDDGHGLVLRTADAAGRSPADVDGLLYGPPPTDDAGLVRLATNLRELRDLRDPGTSGADAAAGSSRHAPTGGTTRVSAPGPDPNRPGTRIR